MSSCRGRANHSLYLAKILLAAWQRECDGQILPQRVLCQAYLPAVRSHLLDAYGWFLLAITGATQLPHSPPQRCDDLPELPPGKAIPGEILEFRQLETAGWLADLLEGWTDTGATPVRGPGNLVTAAEFPTPEQAQSWVDGLSEHFERMGNNLEEC
jgi:hypothetical protein